MAADRDVPLKVRIESSWDQMKQEHRDRLFRLLMRYPGIGELTCRTAEALKAVESAFQGQRLHYEGEWTEFLKEAAWKDRLTVWIPYEKLELAEEIKEYAHVGVTGVQNYRQLEAAENAGAYIVQTPGQIKPVQRKGFLADMHTHSRNSMDASVPVVDLCRGEIEGGAGMVAITEHEEMQWLDTRKDYDMDAFLLGADSEIREVRKELGDEIEILQGIELGQAAWYPEEADRLIHLLPFDIIVGCVHEIRDPSIPDKVEAITPWQSFFKPEFAEKRHMFWEQYFQETLVMVQTVDIDTVAHMGFVARSAKVRIGLDVDLHPYEKVIREILQCMIDKGIALEVNSGGFASSGTCSTPDWILELYRDMGGYLITLASDAHGAKCPVNAAFPQVADKLRAMGFRNIFYYKGRRSYPCAL